MVVAADLSSIKDSGRKASDFALSSDLSSKQDALSEAQLSAIDAVVDERATVVTYNDSTVSSYSIVGKLANGMLGSKSNITSVKIGSSVTAIGLEAFDSCTKMSSLVVPSTVLSIEYGAFSWCERLSSIEISSDIASIPNEAFAYCSKLESLVIPSSVSAVGSWAFSGCSSLSYIVAKGKSQAEAATLLANASVPSTTKVIAIQVEHSNMVELEWQSLKSMKDLSLLKPGMQYRITDYVATTNGSASSMSAGNPFDVIVTADSASTLNENARAALHAGDTYFSSNGCSLQAWKLKYCLENDTSRFAWADATSGKGVVFWMQDEFGNEAPYDFKGIQFIAYGDSDNVHRYTFDSGSASSNIDTSLAGLAN